MCPISWPGRALKARPVAGCSAAWAGGRRLWHAQGCLRVLVFLQLEMSMCQSFNQLASTDVAALPTTRRGSSQSRRAVHSPGPASHHGNHVFVRKRQLTATSTSTCAMKILSNLQSFAAWMHTLVHGMHVVHSCFICNAFMPHGITVRMAPPTAQPAASR